MIRKYIIFISLISTIVRFQICDHLPDIKALPKVDRGILSSSSLYASLPDWPSLLGDFDLGHLKLLKGDFERVRDLADPLPPNVPLLLLSTLDVPDPRLPDTVFVTAIYRWATNLVLSC